MPQLEGTIEAAPLLGGRLFWVHAGRPEDAVVNAVFAELDAAHSSGDGGPIGVCFAVEEPDAGAEVVWPGTELLLAGHLYDGRQVRIRYFEDAIIGPAASGAPTARQMLDADYSLGDRYSVVPFAESGVDAEDVIAFWIRERAMLPEDGEEEARRRVSELHMVALEGGEKVAGVSTVYLERSEQLRMDLWHYRAFVGREHRASNIASRFALDAPALLAERYVSGEDRRGAGVLFEIENEILKTYLNRAVWLPSNFFFIGENGRGDHLRVHYFPGAVVPAAS